MQRHRSLQQLANRFINQFCHHRRHYGASPSIFTESKVGQARHSPEPPANIAARHSPDKIAADSKLKAKSSPNTSISSPIVTTKPSQHTPIELRPYQEECIQASLEAFSNGLTSAAVSLPTGAGKTVVFSQLIHRYVHPDPARTKVLILAHRTELLTQAKSQLLRFDPTLNVQIEAGSHKASVSSADVVVASVATLGRKDTTRLDKFFPEEFKLIIIDEAHHSAARQYRNVIAHFCPELDDKADNPDADFNADNYTRAVDGIRVWGCSATLARHDGKALDDVFQQVVYFKTLKEMMQEGWLSQVKAKRIRTDIRVNPIKITKGDYQINQLSEAINSPDRNELIVEQYKRYCQGLRQSTLIFCVDIAHVTALEEAFRLSHVHCASVTAKTNAYDRQRIMEEFCRGELPVLLNCAVLTEGTDVPNVDCVILARPTCSQPLFTQMVGRGLRQHPGKADCLVLDIVDNFDKHSLSNVSFSLLGLSSETTDVQGRAVVEKTEEEVKEQKDEQKEKAEVFVGAFANTQMTVEDLDAYREMVPSATFMERAMVSVDDAWALKLKAGCICMFYNPATELYEAMLLPNSARGQLQRIPMTCESEDQAFKAIMTHVRDRYTHEFKMLVLNQQASSAPATNNQLRLLNKLIPHAPIAQHLTKSQATKKIGDTLARRTVKQWRRRLGDMLQG